MPEGFHSLADEEALQAVLDLARSDKRTPRAKSGEIVPAFEQFLSQLVRFATGEDRYWNEPASLLARSLAAWKASEKRKPGAPVVSLRLDRSEDWRESRLVLEIAADDMPFIVDSVTAALVELGKTVFFFVNAVVNVGRDSKGVRQVDGDGRQIAESMIHAEMDPPIDDGELELIENEIRAVLADTAIVVADYAPMRDRLAAGIAQLERLQARRGEDEQLSEAIAFLKKLWDNKFTFLGVRRYSYEPGDGQARFERDPDCDLGILRGAARRVLKTTWRNEGELSPAVLAFLKSDEPLVITKANARSTVHRRVHMDYIGLKTYGPDGAVAGEERFVGLLTSDMYNRPASDIPILRSKIRKVAERSGFRPGGHNAKALVHILETYPRDEMFQADVATLRETAFGILRLYKRPRTKLFLRRDRFDRFVSALVFVPRDRFSSSVREDIGAILAGAFDGYIAAFNPHFGDAALVRVHYIVGISPGAPDGPGISELTRRIRGVTRNWGDNLLDALQSAHKGATPQGLFQKYEEAFDAGYRERTGGPETLDDIVLLESMGDKELGLRVFRRADDRPSEIGIKLYSRGGPLRLSDLIPRLEHLGLSVVHERGAQVKPADGSGAVFWIHDFHTEEKSGRHIDVDAVKETLEDAIAAVLDGRCEDDGFNALVVLAGLHWREAWLLRALFKYLMQGGIQFSQAYIEETLARHAKIARALIAVFHARFNPAGPDKLEGREAEFDAASAKASALLENVESLDEDRIIRCGLSLLKAMTRTNYFQRDDEGAFKPYISFKLVSARVDLLPDPKPYREIFVSGPRVDGVHLRFGPIARGGIRWSDRREDYRTEVLGLVKAQRVKNAVIVPTGSKGGFYPKQLPADGDRAAIVDEARAAYIAFIRGLLDLTDNLVAGETVTPANVVRWDEPDPYLVVAADKGTSAFSDTANAISADYGYWLGDAFASGGSAGYDHKVMGITARGAWEAVKRHFREMGKDIQTEAFTVAGIGDMSGDVFGNGMLLSEQIRLLAAFDHRDIFIDPDPDAATSFAERKRMFCLARSSWRDYDETLISKGGGVFSRTQKSIPVSAEMKSLFGLEGKTATPPELMRAILKAPVELFWLGGIGTFYKAASEDDADVGDRANDAIRVDARDMRMQVVGEGANLGLTQAARIAYAQAGGRLNTDAIDNSAGVDSSDHEVNIKILLSGAIDQGELGAEDRNELLKDMTEDVAQHVLRHNYDQTRAISLMQATAAEDIDAYGRLMNALESTGNLDRAIEGLPDEKNLTARKAAGDALTRPELAILMAYSKLELSDRLVDSHAPDDQMVERELYGYFPDETHKFSHAILKHRLRREIVATRLSNEIVNTCGATFVHRLMELTGAGFADIALSYEAARRILNLGEFALAVDALDNKVAAALQIDLYNTAASLIAEQVFKILGDVEAGNVLAKRGVKGLIDQYREPIQALKVALPEVLPPPAAKALKARAALWRKRGAPDEIADRAALMASLEFAFDVVNLARERRWPAEATAAVFFAVGHRFHIEQARSAARAATPEGHFERLASLNLIEDLSARQKALAGIIAGNAGKPPQGRPADWLNRLFDNWREKNAPAVERFKHFMDELDIASGVSIGKLSLMNQKLGDLTARAGGR